MTTLRGTLDAIEREWARLGAPITEGLRPGLPFEEIDTVAEGFGWVVPPELRIWWNWHDGVDHTRRRSIGPGGYEFLPLAEALEYTRLQREWAPPTHAPAAWKDSWLVFARTDNHRLYVDCEPEEPNSGKPVGLVPWEWDGARLSRASSLHAAADLWHWALAHDHYAVEPGGDLWPVDYRSWPLWLKWSGLV